MSSEYSEDERRSGGRTHQIHFQYVGGYRVEAENLDRQITDIVDNQESITVELILQNILKRNYPVR